MKKILTAAIVTILIIAAAIAYITHSNILRHGKGVNDSSVASGQKTSAGAGNVSFGEYTYELSGGSTIKSRYIKSGDTIKIYSVYPADSKDSYDISSNGSTAVYAGKDGDIWALMNDGTCKKITPDTYGTIEKNQIQKQIPGYVWAEKPVLLNDGMVRFISDLPDSSSPKESIWEIDISSLSMKKIYTPVHSNYKYLGYRDDGKMMIFDGQTLAAVNESDGSVQNIDVKGKRILSLSPNGEKIIYARENNAGQADYSRLYIMDGYGKNNSILPGVGGYKGSSIGCWSPDSLKYAFVLKPSYSTGDKIAVISFEDSFTSIKTYEPESSTKFPDSSSISWSIDGSISVDTGSDFINVDLEKTTGE